MIVGIDVVCKTGCCGVGHGVVDILMLPKFCVGSKGRVVIQVVGDNLVPLLACQTNFENFRYAHILENEW